MSVVKPVIARSMAASAEHRGEQAEADSASSAMRRARPAMDAADRQTLADQLRDGDAVVPAGAEVPGEDMTDPRQVLDDDRLIEAELRVDGGDALRRRLVARQGGRRAQPAGGTQRERDDRGEEEHRHAGSARSGRRRARPDGRRAPPARARSRERTERRWCLTWSGVLSAVDLHAFPANLGGQEVEVADLVARGDDPRRAVEVVASATASRRPSRRPTAPSGSPASRWASRGRRPARSGSRRSRAVR